MSKSKRELSSEEKKLWRRVAASVRARKPLPVEDSEEASVPPRVSARVAAPSPAVAVKPKPRPASKPAPLHNRANEKRVRRGKLEIGGTLDLHGHTQQSGQDAVVRFLKRARARGDSAVIIVTGVGRGGEGVLKRRLPEWLAQLGGVVSGYAPAHRSHGGAGAFYVFLKRLKETDE